MKTLISLLLLLTINAFATEFVCTKNLTARSTGKMIKVLKGHSSQDQDRACHWAESFCQEQIEELELVGEAFCIDADKMPISFDGRVTPMKAYYRGELMRTFGEVCYGSDFTDAKEYCKEKLRNQCEAYTIQAGEYGWYCSFL